MNRFFGHLRTVLRHKRYVFRCMAQCGHPLQGFLHDMSKFSPAEFWTSVKYYQGFRSPIDAEKEDKGYSLAWFHHRGRNKHHSQYWCDISFGEVKPCRIPEKYLLELICDTIGAGKAYLGKDWNSHKPIEWFTGRDKNSFYHPETKKALYKAYMYIDVYGWDQFAKAIRTGKLHLYEDTVLTDHGKA